MKPERMPKKFWFWIWMSFFLVCQVFPQADTVSNFIVVRPENNGRMNLIPCHVELVDASGQPIDSKGLNTLIGGESVSFRLLPGKYRLRMTTPISEQGRYLETGEHEWDSGTVIVKIPADGVTKLFVVPTHRGATYTGGRTISERQTEPRMEDLVSRKSAKILQSVDAIRLVSKENSSTDFWN